MGYLKVYVVHGDRAEEFTGRFRHPEQPLDLAAVALGDCPVEEPVGAGDGEQDPQAAVDCGIDELAGSRLRRRRQEAREGCCAQALHERIELGPNPLRGGLPGGFGDRLPTLSEIRAHRTLGIGDRIRHA